MAGGWGDSFRKVLILWDFLVSKGVEGAGRVGGGFVSQDVDSVGSGGVEKCRTGGPDLARGAFAYIGSKCLKIIIIVYIKFPFD